MRPMDSIACRIMQTDVDLASGSNSVEFARSLNEIGVLHYLQNDTGYGVYGPSRFDTCLSFSCFILFLVPLNLLV